MHLSRITNALSFILFFQSRKSHLLTAPSSRQYQECGAPSRLPDYLSTKTPSVSNILGPLTHITMTSRCMASRRSEGTLDRSPFNPSVVLVEGDPYQEHPSTVRTGNQPVPLLLNFTVQPCNSCRESSATRTVRAFVPQGERVNTPPSSLESRLTSPNLLNATPSSAPSRLSRTHSDRGREVPGVERSELLSIVLSTVHREKATNNWHGYLFCLLRST